MIMNFLIATNNDSRTMVNDGLKKMIATAMTNGIARIWCEEGHERKINEFKGDM